jgi:hypothetical protein
MDTNGYWLHSNTFIFKWNPRMEYADLKTAFQCVVDALKVADQSVTVIFDLSETKHIDICAPMNAINSGFLYQRNLKEILIVKADQ